MKTSNLKVIAVFAAASLVASVSVAKNGSSNHSSGSSFKLGSSSGSKSGGVSAFKLGGGNNGGNNNKNNNGNNNNNHKSDIGKAIAAQLILNGLNNGNHGNHGNNGNGNCNNNNNNNGNCNNGNNNNGGNCNNNNNNGDINDPFDNQGANQEIPQTSNLGRSFEPTHSSYVVLPGDTLFEVSLKEYGLSANAKFIAQFNNLGQNPALVVGQTLQIPAISATGQLSVSRSPAAESLQTSPVTGDLGTTGDASNFASVATAAPATTVAPAVSAPLPKVPVGSTLLVDGQSFGDKQGAARLRVGGAALKIEVVEWTGSSVKIRLPQLDLASSMTADIEVVRADGSLASKTGVELNAPTEVALAQ